MHAVVRLHFMSFHDSRGTETSLQRKIENVPDTGNVGFTTCGAAENETSKGGTWHTGQDQTEIAGHLYLN